MKEVKGLGVRGCGRRDEGGLYAVCEGSPIGRPIQDFYIDPCVEWKGPRLRAPMIAGDSRGVNHILLGVGSTYYPFAPDFIEEGLSLGSFSKRIPRDFDFSKLIPKRSKMALIHAKAIPQFPYEADFNCPKRKVERHECMGALWPLSALSNHRRLHLVEEVGVGVRISTPSCTYLVRKPRKPQTNGDLKYKPGIFIALPITRFEYVSKKRKAPRELRQLVEGSGFELEVCLE